MDSLVLELQRDAMCSTIRVTDLLRKALVVAQKLSVPEFHRWVSSELGGYKPGDIVPDYRRVLGEIGVWNPCNGLWIPVVMEDDKMAELLSSRPFNQPAGELESVIQSQERQVRLALPLPPKIESHLMDSMEFPMRPVFRPGEGQIQRILEAVRNTVLTWALKLEEEGILGDGMTFTQDEKDKARKTPAITINHFQGILGDVLNSTVSQEMSMIVHEGDLSSLESYLRSKGLTAEDVSELAEAIRTQERPSDCQNFGPKISAWIGRMVSKAASGSWTIGAATAADLLARAIAAYYGLG